MATHRRGLRPSQWPVRDLLGPDGDRGRLWDARIGAALAGLLACGAAVTVVLTSGDAASSDAPSGTPQPRIPQPEPPRPEPWALPPPSSVPVPAAPPAFRVPPPVASSPVPAVAGPGHRVDPAPTRHADRPVARPRRAPDLVRPAATAPDRAPEPTLAEQIAAGIEQAERRSADSPVVGWVLVPVRRPADAAALLEVACGDCTRTSDGRQQARERADRADRADRSRVGRHRMRPASDDRTDRERERGHRDDEPDSDGQDRIDEDRADEDRADEDRAANEESRDDEPSDDEPDGVQRTAGDDHAASDGDRHGDDRDTDGGFPGWFDAA